MGNYKKYTSPDEVETAQSISHPQHPDTFLPVRRSNLRLPDVNYASRECICFVTFKLHPHCQIRLENQIAETAWQTLNLEIKQSDCTVFSLCLMPDHVHPLVSPSGNGETISDIVGRFKAMIYQSVRVHHALHLKWQTSFYDHVVKEGKDRAEEIELISGYIFNNPDRANLGDDYPYRRRS